MFSTYDVIVLGGGPAGYPAAVQAARMGAKVLLVERSGMLGGTTSLNQVAFPGIFHAWGRQVIAGIGWEVTRRTVELEGRELPDFSDVEARHWRHQIRLNGYLYAALADEVVRGSGADPLLHTQAAALAAKGDGGGWDVQLCGKDGLFTVSAKWLIDATGDANLAHLAGAEFLPLEAEIQPGTLVFYLGGYDQDAIDVEAVDAAAAVALAEGRLRKGDFGWSGSSLAGLIRDRGGNKVHITGINAADSQGKTAAEVAGREALLRVFRFLKTQPGFEKLTVADCAPECGIRETRRIKGRETITYDDYVGGRAWEDAVCYSFYPIDLHTDHGLVYERLKPGIVPTIPLGALTPVGVPRLLVAGRCASGDRLANSAYRVQASCMGMGQAAGAVAALAAEKGLDEAEAVPPELWRRALEEQGAIVPEKK
jgi:hypothetical protein